MPNPARLSLCMIARNEVEHLAACLNSVRCLADEMIVVDTGSTDGTPELAAALGARVFRIPWPDDFSIARNHGLAEAKGAWILVLDADESLSSASAEKIGALLERPAETAFTLIQKSVLPQNKEVQTAIVRLFPNRSGIRFERPIHEEVRLSLQRAGVPVIDSYIFIDHVGYLKPERVAKKEERNRQIITRAINQSGTNDPVLLYSHALNLYKEKDFPAAAKTFERSAAAASIEKLQIKVAADLKAAECYLALGDEPRALSFLPTTPRTTENPRALELRGQIAARRSEKEEARRWYEAILPAPAASTIPPVVWAPLKTQALYFLSEYWESIGQEEIAMRVLALAKNVENNTQKDVGAEIGELYAALTAKPQLKKE